MDCPICIEKYNENTRKKITCKCNYEACLKCVKTYILDKSHLNPHCMSCRSIWGIELIQTYFSKYFINKDYRQMREKILFEEEKTFFPGLQDEAKRLMDVEKIRKKIDKLYLDREKNDKNEDQLVRDQRIKQRLIDENVTISRLELNKLLYLKHTNEKKIFIMKCIKENCRGFLSEKYKCGLCSINVCKDCHQEEDDDHKCNPDDISTIKELEKTTKPCPKCHIRISKIDGCFAKNQPILMYDNTIKMSQDIILGDILTGDDGKKRTVNHITKGEDEMYEVKQNNGETYIVNSKHKLVLKYIENIIEITVSDYIILPEVEKNKLFGFKSFNIKTPIKITSIGKGDYYGWSVDHNKRFLLPDHTVVRNCDQMFCIQCHTPFSWKSGKEELGVIHNPHYFEALRNGNITEIRHRQNQGECGPIPTYTQIDNHLHYSGLTRQIIDKMYNYYREFIHHRQVTLTYFNNREDRNEERLKYLTGKYDEKKFKQKLYVYHESSLRKKEEHEIMSSYVTIGEELFRSLSSKNVENIYLQLSNLSKITKATISALTEKYKYAGLIKPNQIYE